MNLYAVLTGDIVKSRQIIDRPEIMYTLKRVLDSTRQEYQTEYDLYRGDSFQLVLPSPSSAILVAIIIRSKLISSSPNNNHRWDARISVGIGEITYRGDKITDSDGQAFQLSGQGLSEIEKQDAKLVLKAPWQQADRNLGLTTKFADNIISNWSKISAETAYYQLVYKESQTLLAKRLGKSQSTINHRMATAKLKLINAYIQHVKEHINWELQAWR